MGIRRMNGAPLNRRRSNHLAINQPLFLVRINKHRRRPSPNRDAWTLNRITGGCE